MGGADSKHRATARASRHPSHLADRPSPPGKPLLVPSDPQAPEPDVVTIRWEPPLYDGGSRITGYLVEHRRTGSPHWVRSAPALVKGPELTLSGLEPGWRYQFRVSAQNAAGLSEPGDLSDLLTVTLQRTAASAPHFVKELKNTVALENEKAELSVQVRGTPTPNIAWFKDGTEIFSSRSYRIVTDNETSTLIIHQAALSDEGEIKCSATNRVGYAVTRAKLTLEAPPSIRLPRQYEEGLLFEKDEVIRLKVSVAGRPVPEVAWLLNGEPVPGGGRYEASHSERYATLRVGEARREDRGEYQVRASNRLGEDVASFLVTVADRPMQPGRAKVVMTLGRSVTLSWTTPEDDGGCKIGNYIVEYYRLGWNMWLKAATCRQLTTTLGDLIEGSQYKFRVKAENPYGVSEPSPESDVIFLPDPKRGLLEPPELGSTEKDTEMDVWMEDKKRPISPGPTIDDQYGERKTKRKRGPMAPPQAVSENKAEKRGIKTEEKCAPITLESFQPQIPKRRGKVEKYDNKETMKEVEPTRDQRENRRLDELKRFEEIRKAEQARRIEELKMSEELRKPQDPTKTEEDSRRVSEKTKFELKVKKESVTPLKISQKEPQTNVKEPTKPFKEQFSPQDTQLPQKDPRKSQTPRVDHDPLHGSSELMLVLLPDSRAATEERETSKRELFESSMAMEGEDIAPPMSLSAPELGSGDPPELPLRSAFSSTELLQERAMARFYQDMVREEAESSLRRKNSLQRRRSFERRSPHRSKNIPDTAGSLQNVALPSVKECDNHASPVKTVPPTTAAEPVATELPYSSSSPRVYSDKKTVSRDSMDSMLSVEDPHRKSTLVQQASEEDMEYEDSSFDEDEVDYDEEEDEDEEEIEPITDEIMDEDLEEELEEEEDDEFSTDEKRGSLYTSESEEESRYSYSMEEDTYHPSDVNKKYNEDTMISAYEGRGPLILGSATFVPPPVHSTVSQVPSGDIKLKPILKRPTVDRVVFKNEDHLGNDQSIKVDDQSPKPRASPEKRFEPNFSPAMPKPILKVRDSSQEPHSPIAQRRGIPMSRVESEINLETNNTHLDEGSDFETGTKKKQVRIEEPEDITARASFEADKKQDSELADLLNKTQTASEEPVRERTGSLSDEGDTSMVLVSHYSDIVAEYGRGRRPPRKLYLNYDALKAAAEEEEENVPDVPEIVVNEPELEPEPAGSSVIVEPKIATERESNIELDIEDHNETNHESIIESPKKLSPAPIKKRSPSPRKPKSSIASASTIEDSSPEKTEYIRTPSPELPPRIYTRTEKKVHSYFDFFMDVSLFILACWLYVFKDERLSIPVLCLMIYRQAHEAFQRKMEAIRQSIPRRVLFWRRQQ